MTISQTALATAKTLPNFTPGDYVRTEGPADKCGEGRFKLTDGQTVSFGQHPFSTRTNSQTFPSDIPEEAGCVYDVRDLATPTATATELKFIETLRCSKGSVTRHTLVRTAIVRPGQVVIDIRQQGNSAFADEETYGYQCAFTLARPG